MTLGIKQPGRGAFVATVILSVLPAIGSVQAESTDIQFIDVVPDIGVSYERTASESETIWQALKAQEVLAAIDIPFIPTKSRGDVGVATFDFDGDGDLDIYVTNGPGSSNSLYQNQYAQTGNVTFVDVAELAQVAAASQDSTGVCFGDIDNDGDSDLYVLGNAESNLLFENQSDGTFIDITLSSGLSGGDNTSSSCSFGDVNSDGRLDVVVANLFDSLEHRLPIMLHDFSYLNSPNQLFVNAGQNVFEDKSESSGIQTVAGITWAIALVDYDLDGDVDLFVADDQGAKSPAKNGGEDIGLLRLYENDGKGVFTEMTHQVAGGRFGAWMSLSFGDLNGDGYMDIFGSNVGDYFGQAMAPVLDFVPVLGDWNSGWFLGDESSNFSYPGLGDLKATPFGWGSSIVDYDNDGDLDIIYQGGWENGVSVDASNPGAVLKNDGSANFSRDEQALANSTDHARRIVHGVATGDLNNDGFIDVVSASSANWPAAAPLINYFGEQGPGFGGPFDGDAKFMPTFTPVDMNDLFKGLIWNQIDLENGSLSIEINSGDNGNHSVAVKLLGTQGLTSGGRVNRDAIGAVVTFKPREGKTAMKPVLSGGSHASSHSLDLTFGLGSQRNGTVEVLWPGGVRNRLYKVRADEHVEIPEIPCSFDDASLGFHDYLYCVQESLVELRAAGELSSVMSFRLLFSAVRSYHTESIMKRGSRISFENLSEKLDFAHNTNGGEGQGGVAWLDYNNDGELDVFMTNGRGYENVLFENNGDGTFSDVSEHAGIKNGLGNSGALAGDIDNDGYPDLFLTGAGGLFTPQASAVKLYHNNGDGTFSDITAGAGINGLITSWGAAFGDVNGDGYVDLLVTTPGSVIDQRQETNKFFLNNGDLTFTDISSDIGVDSAFGGCLAGFSDYDNDGDQDILLGNCNEIHLDIVPLELFRNDGDLNFVNVTEEAGLNRRGAWMGLAIGDYDNDGDQDLFATNLGNFPGLFVHPVFYENNGDGTFSDVTEAVGVSENLFGWGATLTDFNNDGFLDLFYTGSFPFAPFNMTGPLVSPGTLYVNNRDKTFTNKDHWFGMDLSDQFTSGVAAADYNRDGFADLVIVSGSLSESGSLMDPRTDGHPILLANKKNDNHWVTIKTVGVESNRGGIGTKVEVKSGDLVQVKEVRAGSSYLSTESPWLTFGLYQNTKIDSIKVYWPSGLVQEFEHSNSWNVDATYKVIEGSRIKLER